MDWDWDLKTNKHSPPKIALFHGLHYNREITNAGFKSRDYRNISTFIFTVVLSKQPSYKLKSSCPSADEYMRKITYAQ